ncbi:MAG: glycosyltransferase family 39 protein [Pseudomonadota bacterium]
MSNATKIFFTLVFCSLCLFSTLGGRTLENMDYFKYAEIGREVLEFNSWTILHYNGGIYVDKPPFHYWNVALSYMAFGVNTFAARFPSALFALITLLIVLFFTLRETGSLDAGILSCLILLSSYGFFFFSHRTRVDIEYGAFFSLSLVTFYAGMKEARCRSLMFSLFWLFTGIGFMYKGPVIFLNLAVVIAYWLLAIKKGFSYAPVKPFLLTLPLVILPAVPWLYKLFKHKDFLQYVAIFQDKEIMKRNAGIFYYIPELIKKFSPALLFLPVFYKALKTELHKDKNTEAFIWFLLIWFGSIFLLLHIPAAKTHRYLIPIYPPLAILAGWGIAIAVRDGLYKQFLHWSGAALSAGAACFFMALPFIVWKKYGLALLPFIMSFLMLAAVYI